MNFGYLGVQFGWGLQLANMSAIYTILGAEPHEIAKLWIAGPVCGLLIQPLVGAMSDRTWTKLGRRRPYFLGGAILASIALVLMPESSSIWVAFGLLWLLDASTNVSQEPFRAFVADKLNKTQQTLGFVFLSFFVGVGHSISSAMPRILSALGVAGEAANGLPLTIQYSFRLGAIGFIACILWTVFTAEEYPPEDMEEFERKRKENPGLLGMIKEVFGEFPDAIKNMPLTMKQVGVVHMFTFIGLFCMWMFFSLTTCYHVFGAPDKNSALFKEGVEWAGWCFAIYAIVCCFVSLDLNKLSKIIGRKMIHAIALAIGGLSLLSIYFITDPQILQLTMIGIGITWASTLSMPYAILASALPPNKYGVYMGLFNCSIVIPEIVTAFMLEPLVKHVFNNNPLYVVMLGGVFLLIAACSVYFVKDPLCESSAEGT